MAYPESFNPTIGFRDLEKEMESTGPVQEWLNTPIPERLWHYTSIDGFCGITTSKQIFATDFRFLNDREEFTHARKIAEELVEEAPTEVEQGIPYKELLRKIVQVAFDPNTGVLHPNNLQFFVASFSEAEDQLSQWRGYSRGSSGVSLCLNLRSLRPEPGSKSFVSFGPCRYDSLRKRELISHALDQSTSEALQIAKGVDTESSRRSPNERIEAALKVTVYYLIQLVAFLKNESFHEEQEWRLVVPMAASDHENRHLRLFRASSTTLVPYIRHSLSKNPEAPIPLVDLILGPGSDEHAVVAAQSFLDSCGIDLKPRLSAVPYQSR